jgi:hypothetical protein
MLATNIPALIPLYTEVQAEPPVRCAEWDHTGGEYVVLPTAFGLIEMIKSFPSEKKFNWLELIKALIGKDKRKGISSAALSGALGRNPRVTSRNNWKQELQAFLREAMQRDKIFKVE